MTPSNTLRFTLAILCAAPLALAGCTSSNDTAGGDAGAMAGSGNNGDGDGDASTGNGDGDGDGDGDASVTPGDGDGDGDASVAPGDGDASVAPGDGGGDSGVTPGDSGGGGGTGSACYTADPYGDVCSQGAEGSYNSSNCDDVRDGCPDGWSGKCTIGNNLSTSHYYSDPAAALGENACALGSGVWEDGE